MARFAKADVLDHSEHRLGKPLAVGLRKLIMPMGTHVEGGRFPADRSQARGKFCAPGIELALSFLRTQQSGSGESKAFRSGPPIAPRVGMPTSHLCVYVIRSTSHPDRFYTGLTDNVQRRLDVHNSGGSQHTASLRPWTLVSFTAFANPDSAKAFEKYLKTGSGRAFSKRHFV